MSAEQLRCCSNRAPHGIQHAMMTDCHRYRRRTNLSPFATVLGPLDVGTVSTARGVCEKGPCGLETES